MLGRSISRIVVYYISENKTLCFENYFFFKNRKKYYGILYLFSSELSFGMNKRLYCILVRIIFF